jgi:hypothetical protein
MLILTVLALPLLFLVRPPRAAAAAEMKHAAIE